MFVLKKRSRFGSLLAGIAVVGALGLASAASASSIKTYNFSNNIGGTPGSESGAGFTLTVEKLTGGQVAFTFYNDSHVDGSSITGIYFYDGVVFEPTTADLDGNPGKLDAWNSNSGAPGHLPGDTSYFGPDSSATLELWSGALQQGGIKNGIGVGQHLIVKVDLLDDVSFTDMINMLEAGFGIADGEAFDPLKHFVIGIQVQGLDGDGSAQYVVHLIPLPAPVLMGLAGLFGVAVLRRRSLFVR